MSGQLAAPARATYSTNKEWKVPAVEGKVSCDDEVETQFIRLAVTP
jgi:hypothetical protein